MCLCIALAAACIQQCGAEDVAQCFCAAVRVLLVEVPALFYLSGFCSAPVIPVLELTGYMCCAGLMTFESTQAAALREGKRPWEHSLRDPQTH